MEVDSGGLATPDADRRPALIYKVIRGRTCRSQDYGSLRRGGGRLLGHAVAVSYA